MKKFDLLKFFLPIRIVTVVCLTLLCIAIVGNATAGAYANSINHAFNITTFKIVNKTDDDTDTMYFKSGYAQPELDEDFNLVYTADDVKRLTADAESLCAEVEREGLVLLKNEGALPLASGSAVSLFGQGSVTFNYGTSGSSAASTSGYATLKKAMESVGITVNGTLWDHYMSVSGGEKPQYKRALGTVNGVTVYQINEPPWDGVKSAAASSFASFGDAAVVVISRNSGEGMDVSAASSDGANGSYLSLCKNETDMLEGLTELKKAGTFKNIIVVLNSANTVQLDFLKNPKIDVDACMWVGNVGKTGIYGVAQVMAGSASPSGKLSDTYVYDNFSSPAMASWALNANKMFGQKYKNAANYSGLNATQYNYGVYVEGIYVGYRYYETRYEDIVTGAQNAGTYDYAATVAYPFGHGLSYAKFEYGDYSVTETDKTYEISVEVTNISDRYDGKEVVQVYLQKPYTGASGPEVASVELVGYKKTAEPIAHGTSQTVTLSVDKERFAVYDVNANGGKGGYVLEKGDHYLAVGKNAHDALNNILAAKAKNGASVNAAKMTEAGNADLAHRINRSARDENAYALSKETGKRISNKLDFADINKAPNRGDNSVTYLSRADWSGTFPKFSVSLVLTDGMAEDLGIHKPLPTGGKDMPKYGKNNGMSLAMLRSNEETIIRYDSDAWDTFLDQMTYEQQALLLANAAFGTVAFNPPLNKPGTKDNDGPTGVVGSKTGTSFPSEGIWASSFNDELIERVGVMLAEDALYNGYNSLYATGINIHRTPFGGRAHEYFSEDPFLTGAAVCAEVTGMQSKGVIPTLKHYAFNDEEDKRGGICIWLNEQAAREIYLKPFEMAMRPSMGKAHAIMTSFNRAGCIWTSASSELMIDIARDEWNFDGYSITDMAESFKYYMTYDDGIMNGTDLYLATGDEYALSDYAYSIPFRKRVREACHRVLYVITNYSAAMNGISASSQIINITPGWQIALYVLIAVFAVLTAAGVCLWVLCYILPYIRSKKKEESNE